MILLFFIDVQSEYSEAVLDHNPNFSRNIYFQEQIFIHLLDGKESFSPSTIYAT